MKGLKRDFFLSENWNGGECQEVFCAFWISGGIFYQSLVVWCVLTAKKNPALACLRPFTKVHFVIMVRKRT
jgi:hypothetical protein